jgi:hypothetical protein
VARDYVTLAEHSSDMVRLACTKCERRGQYRKATLIERYGPDKNLIDLRLELAAGCLSGSLAATAFLGGYCCFCVYAAGP